MQCTLGRHSVNAIASALASVVQPAGQFFRCDHIESQQTLETVQGSVKVDWVEREPSPTALRSPLSPWRGIKIEIPTLSLRERGDRKAVGEGSIRR